ncbi:MAG: hypothetical protein JSU63_11655 [Phycisphaerales bacterium]|nr:MAG: hypothetical protein JSU63_11655 [Phycisphaerales bacterium]
MKVRSSLAILPVLLAWSMPPTLAKAQTISSPDVVVDLNEAIYHYMTGGRERYETAIELLDGVLEKEPENPAALLFRALTHGRVGLLENYVKAQAEDDAFVWEKLIEMRGDPQLLEQAQREMAELSQAPDESADDPTTWILDQTRLVDLEKLVAMVTDTVQDSVEQLAENLRISRAARYSYADRERAEYRLMTEDLKRLIRVLDHPQAVIRLLKVIALSKIARSDEDEALGIKSGYILPDDASGPARALRSSSADILRQTAKILQKLRPTVTGEDAVRTSFFLGVIRYRQAVPQRAPDELPETNFRMLLEAERIMAELADDPQIDRTWRSYAALYLGLIIPFRASLESDPTERDTILDSAEHYLDQAAALDTIVSEDALPRSASNMGIPDVVWRQREQIQRIREAEPTGPRGINDIRLSLFSGLHYDSNVVLLGERTDLPRDIPKEGDFGFPLGTQIDHTLTLKEHWILGVQGRLSQLWHPDVNEFDERRAGFSLALQYEAIPQEGSFGPTYLRLQYDYDYTRLGGSPFLETHAISPNVRVFWDDRRAETTGYLMYENRDYREPLYDSRFDRDGEYFALGLVQQYRTVDMTSKYQSWGIEPWGMTGDESFRQEDPEFPARYLTPFVSLRYAWDSTVGDEFDQKEYALSAGVAAPLPWGLSLDAAAEFQWQEYSHGSLIDFHRRGRRDFIQRYEIGLSRSFVLRSGVMANRYTPAIDRLLMTIRAHATYTDDNSNVVDRYGQAIFEYDRLLCGISVAFSFN